MSKIKVDAVESRNGTLTLGGTGDTVVYTAGSIPNSSLDNSAITINGTAISLGSSGTIPVGIDWQSSIKAANFTAAAGEGYFVNTTSGAITATLPASPSAGDQVAFKDYAATFATNNLTIARNGSNIQGVANDSLIQINRASVVLVYVDATKGWLYTNESNVSDLAPSFVAATGGTITTSGDFKIHTFTSSGTFTVTDAGSAAGSNTVDYLVVASGGSGGAGAGNNLTYGAGGAGAGGYRESFPNPATGGLSVSAQGYPITIGAGGAATSGQNNTGNPGNNSIFSSITSTGGGHGGTDTGSFGSPGSPGGSGGGVTNHQTTTAGAGNSPSVSPPQGNPGGIQSPTPNSGGGGGGGGASSAGSDTGDSASYGGAPGGNGTASSITGSSVTRAGGGGGGAYSSGSPTTAGAGGPGGGGSGASPSNNAGAGTANTGGGGGGSGGDKNTSGAGGSGVVIIRYKFQ
jgi:hypothetical protein